MVFDLAAAVVAAVAWADYRFVCFDSAAVVFAVVALAG